MSYLWRFLGRFPRTISGLIIVAFAAGVWFATDYVENVVKPREAEARQARIGGEIARADSMFDRGKYEVAVAEYAYLLSSFAAELPEAEIARLHDRVGASHVRLAGKQHERQDSVADLERALAAFGRALAIRTAVADEAGEVETRRRIGDAHRALAHARGDAAPLDDAVAAYRAVLDLVGDGDPSARAAALRSLANAHRSRFEVAGDEAALAAAFAIYDEALQAAGPEAWPGVHGETLIDVGLAHVQEAENGYRTRNLLQAVKTLEGAKKFLRLDSFPRAHALLHKHIGDTYVLLANTTARRRSDRAAHQQNVVRWQNRAEMAYRVARSFGFRPAKANLVPGNPGAAAAAVEDDEKKE